LKNIPFLNVLNQLWRDTPKVYNSSHEKNKAITLGFFTQKIIQTVSENKDRHNWMCLGSYKRWLWGSSFRE